MREIKFRVWVAGEMWRCHSLDFGDNDEIGTRVNVSKGGRLGFPLSSVTVEQFTGLKDKNNKDIYEGDIIKLNNKNPDLVNTFEINWTDWPGVVMADGNAYTTELDQINEDCEIVGNIHEKNK